MNTNNSALLATLLQQEIQWVEQLHGLLSNEKNALATRQFSDLDELAQQKQELSEKLEASAAKRASIQGSLASLNEFLKNATSQEAQQLNQLSLKLGETLAACRELNTVNGQVIANNIHSRQEIVNILSGISDTMASVYSSKGTLQTTTKTQYHQNA